MKCSGFERWLDEGMPEAGAPPARGHTAQCDACARRLAAAVEMDALLAEPTEAPAEFTDRLMARVEATPRPAPRVSLPALIPDALPWWVRAAADPATALSFILAGLVLWKMPAIVEGGTRTLARLPDLMRAVVPAIIPPAGPAASTGGAPVDAVATLALAMGFAPLLGWMGLLLYRGSREFAQRTARSF